MWKTFYEYVEAREYIDQTKVSPKGTRGYWGTDNQRWTDKTPRVYQGDHGAFPVDATDDNWSKDQDLKYQGDGSNDMILFRPATEYDAGNQKGYKAELPGDSSLFNSQDDPHFIVAYKRHIAENIKILMATLAKFLTTSKPSYVDLSRVNSVVHQIDSLSQRPRNDTRIFTAIDRAINTAVSYANRTLGGEDQYAFVGDRIVSRNANKKLAYAKRDYINNMNNSKANYDDAMGQNRLQAKAYRQDRTQSYQNADSKFDKWFP